MPASLKIVTEVGACRFCWRSLPMEDLHEGADGALLCNDHDACVAEFRRWESGSWLDHPSMKVAI